MLSKTCEYAIRSMIFVAQRSEQGVRVGIREISKGIGAPEHFIAKILQALSRGKLLQSAKGPNGGFFLDEDSKKTTLADIVTAIDGDKIFTGCALGLKNCSENKPCPLHDEFKSIRTQIHHLLQSSTITGFNKELTKGLTFLKRD